MIRSSDKILHIFHVKDTCDIQADAYVDDNKPSRFDIDALIYAYGRDGFKLPNRPLLFINNFFTYGPSPIKISNNVQGGTSFALSADK